MNILILGAGHSAKRFVQANIQYNDTNIFLNTFSNHYQSTFELAKNYNLTMIDYKKVLQNPNVFDIIIFALHSDIIETYLSDFLQSGYKNKIIFEKPFGKNINNYNVLSNHIKNYNIIFSIMYNRRYDNYYISKKSKHQKYYIKIILSIKRLKNCLIDYLTHFLDYIFFCEETYDYKILSKSFMHNKLQIKLLLDNNSQIDFYFIGENIRTPIYYFNEQLMPSPDYTQTHRRIVKETITKKYNEDYLLKSSLAISKILEELEGIFDYEINNSRRHRCYR